MTRFGQLARNKVGAANHKGINHMSRNLAKQASAELTATMQEYVKGTFPGLTPGQTAELVSIGLDDDLVSITRDFGTTLQLDTLPLTLEAAVRSNPRLVSRIPTVHDLKSGEASRADG